MSSSARVTRRWTAAAFLLLGASAAAQESAPPSPPVPPSEAPAARSSEDARPVVSESPRPVSGSTGPSTPPLPEPPQPVAVSPPPPVPPPSDVHEHHGIFIHGDFGFGYLRTSGSRAGSPFLGKGAAVGAGIAIGWAPDDDWAFAVEGWVWRAMSPSGLGSRTAVELQAIGLNVTRYIVPIDFFATVVVSGTRLAITDGGDYVTYDSSDIGFGLKVLLGKEWRVSSDVGIGVAAQLFLSVNRNGDETLDTLGGGLLFSFTFR